MLDKYAGLDDRNLYNGLLQANSAVSTTKSLEDIFKEMETSDGTNSIFDTLDVNNDNQLSNEEIYATDSITLENKEKISKDLLNVFNGLDTNSDGKLSAEEMNKLNDFSKGGITGDLLKKLMVMFGFNIDEVAKTPIQEEIDKIKAEMELLLAPPTATDSVSFGGGGGGGGSGSGSGGGGTDKITQPQTQEEYNAAISKKQDEKNKIKSDSANAISEQEALINDLLNQSLNPEGSELPSEQMAEYQQRDKELADKIQGQQSIIDEQSTIIQDKTAEIGSIDTAISDLNAQIANLQATKANGDTSDPSRNARIDGKISNLKNAISAKEQEKIRIQGEIEKAKDAKAKAEKDKTDLETEKSQLLDTIIQENQGRIAPEVLTQIQNAKAKIQEIKTNEASKIATIDSEIQTLKTGLANLKEKEETEKLIDENKEANFDANGKRIGLRKMPSTQEEYEKYGLETEAKQKAFEKCNPKLKESFIDLADWAREQGIFLLVNASYRSRAQQEALWDNGNNSLAAAPGTSLHESGLAIDLRPYDLEGNRLTSHSVYNKLGNYWTDVLGYTWGGDWVNNTERWHFQIDKKDV